MIDSFARVLRRGDFSQFIAQCFSSVNPGIEYLPGWHIDAMAEYLEAARTGDIRRLIINVPPRSLKSLCVSVAWPAWLLGHAPNSRVMAASYAASLSIKHSLDCRLILQSPWYRQLFPKTVLARGQNERHKFVTDRRGWRIATSIGGAVTGEGGNYLIVDDPLSATQAMNMHWREYVNHWFDHTFSNRLDDKKQGVIVLVMQRLHGYDLAGHLLAKGGWQHLMLPSVAETEQMVDFGRIRLVREVNGLLHSTREGWDEVRRAQMELGSRAFAAQYQQMPVPEEGALVQLSWLKRYATVPEGSRIVQSWDTAIKAGDAHDGSACLTFVDTGQEYYLVEAGVWRLEYPDLKRMVMGLAEKWNAAAILVEDKASGQQLLQELRRESALPVVGIQPRSGKIARFAAVAPLIEAGRLFLPKQAPWLAGFEAELLGFPNMAHDDQVDALTQFLGWVRQKEFDKARVRFL